jgi:hypothetical protein
MAAATQKKGNDVATIPPEMEEEKKYFPSITLIGTYGC